jgi:hypothetical protein
VALSLVPNAAACHLFLDEGEFSRPARDKKALFKIKNSNTFFSHSSVKTLLANVSTLISDYKCIAS